MLSNPTLNESIDEIRKKYHILSESETDINDDNISTKINVANSVENEISDDDVKSKNDKTQAYRISGGIIVLHGKQTNDVWEANCPKCFTAISKEIDINKTLSTGECLSAMTFNKVSMHSIELFLELFTENMVGFLGQMGYPVDKFDIILKLKDGQSTKS
jgi:TusA-related sulfurtransferase